eukprot:gene12316-16584_t
MGGGGGTDAMRGNVFAGADAISPLVSPGEGEDGPLSGAGGGRSTFRPIRPPVYDGSSKWMDLVGAVCRAVGRQGFQALSRRFDQWKYSDVVGGIDAIVHATASTSTTQHHPDISYEGGDGAGYGYGDMDYDYDYPLTTDDNGMMGEGDDMEETRVRVPAVPKVPGITP